MKQFCSLNYLHILGALLVFSASSLSAVENGVYLLKEGPPDNGIKFPGGSPADIDRKLGEHEFELDLVSASNSNDAFDIRFVDKFSTRPGQSYVAIVLGGKVIVEKGGNHSFDKCNADTATRIAAMVGRKPYLRKNVAGQLRIDIEPRRAIYNDRDPIEFAVRIKNEGSSPLFIQRELPSSDRSARMDIMVQEGSPVECDDVRSRFAKATVMEPRSELKPNETVEMRREDLGHWFIPKGSGTPAFTVVYQFEVYETMASKYPIWDAHCADTLTIQYEGKKR